VLKALLSRNPSVQPVSKYLFEVLNDERAICDLPTLVGDERELLFRCLAKVANLYDEWDFRHAKICLYLQTKRAGTG
jgi:hypothetical protein